MYLRYVPLFLVVVFFVYVPQNEGKMSESIKRCVESRVSQPKYYLKTDGLAGLCVSWWAFVSSLDGHFPYYIMIKGLQQGGSHQPVR